MKKTLKHIEQISIKLRYIALAGCLCLNLLSCSEDEFVQENNAIDDEPEDIYQLEALDNPNHYSGIAIYTADMAKNRLTDVNSEWDIRKSQNVNMVSKIIRNKYNAVHQIMFNDINTPSDYVEFVVALHGSLENRIPVPDEMLNNINGISFRAVSFEVPVFLLTEAFDINGNSLGTDLFEVKADEMGSYGLSISSQNVHHLSFKVIKENQHDTFSGEAGIAIDDIYIDNNSPTTFQPSSDDAEMLTWLKQSAIRYFLWNYREVGGDNGVVLESNDTDSKVSVSGLGYAYANYILAEQENMISSEVARARILSMLKWQQSQNWYDGYQGKFGFPLHYYNANGSGLYQSDAAAISTVDWAICAAGIRTVSQKYASDSEIVSICQELLSRPDWSDAIYGNAGDNYRYNRIAKGINAVTGAKDNQVWGDTFTEESDLVYLEADATGQINQSNLDSIFRNEISGFYPSWFGSGFTYNWMQLWTGNVEPFQSNSIAAYQVDMNSCNNSFGQPLIGLTACSSISSVGSNGFIGWNNYYGNQGSEISGAGQFDVVQLSPAPYGAALALPFLYNESVQALREYIDIGYYHPMLGLPDNIRINDLPDNLDTPKPNWSTFDINVGPISLAIDQAQNNVISSYYKADPSINSSLQKIIETF